MSETMTKAEIIQAARALEAWLSTQVPANHRAVICAYYLAFETVTQSTESDFSVNTQRLRQGAGLITGMYANYVNEIVAVAEDLHR